MIRSKDFFDNKCQCIKESSDSESAESEESENEQFEENSQPEEVEVV